MDKQEFIELLKQKESERKYLNHWKCVSDSGEYWRLEKPGVDWLSDDLQLKKDGIVTVNYNKVIYDNTPNDVFEITYDDFAENYDKIVK